MSMKTYQKTLAPVYAAVLLAMSATAIARVPGIGGNAANGTTVAAPPSCSGTGTNTRNFFLTARSGHITLGDGNTLLTWGYSTDAFTTAAVDTGKIQYPGPTLIVCQGDIVNVTLRNRLPDRASIIFPGLSGVTAVNAGGSANGAMTREANAFAGANNGVTYSFRATAAGTYLYQSGSDIETQVEMGLVGALIVRPAGFVDGSYDSHTTERRAYGVTGSTSTSYDVEYLFFETEMDRSAHEAMEAHLVNPTLNPRPNPANFKQTLWFLNGRNGPDTMLKENVAWLPLQPNNALAQMRLIGGGRDLHPFHHHGNNAWMIARDGRVLENTAVPSAPYPDYVGIPASDLTGRSTSLPNQAVSNYTIQTVPGSTYDAIFTWTGKGVDWDIYGNLDEHKPVTAAGSTCTADTRLPFEDPADHCKAFPVVLPEQQALTFGGLWSGSQYLGLVELLPPLQGGLNPAGGFSYMWHSHTERELTNDDVFPGGMMTMMIVQKADSGAVIE
jgi:FtsP/CotA-like multicopper oxidase with cupredoxin domain